MKKNFLKLIGFAAAAVMLAGCAGEKGAGDYVKLGDYQNLEISMMSVGVDEEELNGLMSDVYVGFVTKEHGGITDRAVKMGDTVIIDFEGKKDGVAFQGGTAQDYQLGIGSGQFIPGFEDGLVGVMPGKAVDLDLTFPENYGNEELQGQAVVFTVTVNYILPEKVAMEDMEDVIVASIGIPNVGTGQELRQYVYDWLYSQYEADLQDSIMNLLIERSEFKEFPEKMREPHAQEWTDNIAMNAYYYGISAEDYANFVYNESLEDYVNEMAIRDLKVEGLLQAVAKKENIKVTDDEIQTWVQNEALKYGFVSAEDYMGEKSLQDYREDCLKEKVMRYLMDNTLVTKSEQ